MKYSFNFTTLFCSVMALNAAYADGLEYGTTHEDSKGIRRQLKAEVSWDALRQAVVLQHKTSNNASDEAQAYMQKKSDKKVALRASKASPLTPLTSIDNSAFAVNILDQGEWGTCAGHSAVECLGVSLNFRAAKAQVKAQAGQKVTADEVRAYAAKAPVKKYPKFSVNYTFRGGCWSDAEYEYNTSKTKGKTRLDIFSRDEGATLTGIAHGMQRGFLMDADYPYTQDTFSNEATPTHYSKAKDTAEGFRKKFTQLPETLDGTLDKNALLLALAAGRFVSFGMPVDEGFMSDTTANTGVYKATKGSDLGGHALTAYKYTLESNLTVKGVTYNSSSGWIGIQNHWGTRWGDKGFFYMPINLFLTLASDAYTLELSEKTTAEKATIQASEVLLD